MIVLPFGDWVIGVAPRRVRKIMLSIEVHTSKARVRTFGLSPVIRLGLRNPRKKERPKKERVANRMFTFRLVQ